MEGRAKAPQASKAILTTSLEMGLFPAIQLVAAAAAPAANRRCPKTG